MQRIWRPRPELAQVLAHGARGVTADPGVDLVEHEARGPPSASPRCRGRRSAAPASPGRARRPRRSRAAAPRAGRGWGRSCSSTASAPRGPQPRSRGRTSTVEPRVGHRQLGQPLADRRRQLRRGSAARASPSRPARRVELGPRLRAARTSTCSSATSACSSSLAPGAAALGVRQDLGDRAAVLALQSREQAEALLDLLEASWRRLARQRIAAQLAAEVLGLVAQRAQPLGQRRQRRVDRRRLLELAGCLRRAARQRRPPSSGAIASAPAAAAPAQRSAWRSRSRSAASSSCSPSVGAHGLDLAELEARRRSSSRSRAPASSRSPAALPIERRGPVRRPRAAPPAAAPAAGRNGLSRMSSWAAPSISLRCSCWP